ncbi:futalosine hydrolase [Wenjunlia tyrosinilytica]|uniref:Futalosine hydrolase n=1 Tax=Wenjunlia tyrosinilytica TaxID=1544741 RepID=A0A917ZPZ9_9ACTN|nr:futalosine hydrolase [Wenjunlia tyrosinilytica]GGO86965.1 Futalosine hydrolase [Wenjunlia tyrosinilytica]
MRLLVVTAVAAELDSVAQGLRALEDRGVHPLPGHRLRRLGVAGGPLRADLLAAGVGPGAAAAGAASALATAFLANEAYDLVVAAGIAGGFGGVAPVGSVVVADAIVAADLGAETAAGFLPVQKLGFGTSVHLPPQPLAGEVARTLEAVTGPVLTVSTVTGTARNAELLAARHPGAAAEAMEGFGVAEAAEAHGVPVLEIRAVSNTVGPRDRDAWRIGDALAALTDAFGKLRPLLEKT